MHPVIRIVSFLYFVNLVVLSHDIWRLMICAFVVVLLSLFYGAVTDNFRRIYKLRWLLLSILIIYLYFTPGEVIIASCSICPTWQGVEQASFRLGILVLLLSAANLLLQITTQQQIVHALIWLFQPLGALQQRLAIRIGLIMVWLPNIQKLLANEREILLQQTPFRLQRLSQMMAKLFTHIATSQATVTINIKPEHVTSPPLWQWLMPCALTILWWI